MTGVVDRPTGDGVSARTGVRVVALTFAVSALLMLMAAAVGIWWVDQVGRAVELQTLVSGIQASERAMERVQAEEARVARAYRAGEIADDDLVAELREVAEVGSERIGAAGDRIATLTPRDRLVAVAQAAYLAHNTAWREYLERAAADPTEFSRPQVAITETFDAARIPLLAALPRIDVFDLRPQIDAIFADDGGHTQSV